MTRSAAGVTNTRHVFILKKSAEFSLPGLIGTRTDDSHRLIIQK